jgi:hypothetical protein
VLDEMPGAYNHIDAVMANQSHLVEVVHTLNQVRCVKGRSVSFLGPAVSVSRDRL